MKIYFEVVAIKGTMRWTENGKRRQKTREFSQTINPFNKNADGSIKDRSQIMWELIAQRSDWLKGEKP